MSARQIITGAQADIDEMREVPALRFAHWNRIHAQISRTAREARLRMESAGQRSERAA